MPIGPTSGSTRRTKNAASSILQRVAPLQSFSRVQTASNFTKNEASASHQSGTQEHPLIWPVMDWHSALDSIWAVRRVLLGAFGRLVCNGWDDKLIEFLSSFSPPS